MIFVALLLALVFSNYSVSGSVLYPPTVFALVWTIAVSAVVLAPGTLYPVSSEALMVFYSGALAFSVGGAIALWVWGFARRPEGMTASAAQPRRRLDIALALALCGLPLYVTRVSELAEGADVSFFLATIRVASLAETERGLMVRIADNLVLLANFVAIALFYENDGTWGRRLRAYAAIGLAVVYGALTGSKAPVVWLVLTLLATSWLRVDRLRVLPLVIGVFVVLVSFSAGLILTNFWGDLPEDPSATLWLVVETIQNYAVGGLVAFSEVLGHPSDAGWTGGAYRPFLEIAKSLGSSVEVPSLHAGYTQISLHATTNVYTIYWIYSEDFGILGGCLLMVGLGVVSTWLYGKARTGQALATAFYALVFAGMVLTTHGEHFINGLSNYVKALLFWLLIYTLARRAGGLEELQS